MIDPKASFTAADAFPIKLIQDIDTLCTIKEERKIPPVHIQFIPTNRCNLRCSFCSCAEEDRSLEMSLSDMTRFVDSLFSKITKGITITGGGEPLLYPYFDEMIYAFHKKGIKAGLVTNGVLLHKQKWDTMKKLSWCRISQGDDREPLTAEFVHQLAFLVKSTPNVDWAFSYVVSATPNYHKILEMIELAEYLEFSHIRLVADLFIPDQVPMEKVQEEFSECIHDFTVPIIFQGRQTPEHGKDCRICYLKPIITPDMKIYACCGAQYALEVPSKKFPEELCLGNADDLLQIYKDYDGSSFEGAKHCVKCYYGDYNRALKMLFTEIKHEEFV